MQGESLFEKRGSPCTPSPKTFNSWAAKTDAKKRIFDERIASIGLRTGRLREYGGREIRPGPVSGGNRSNDACREHDTPKYERFLRGVWGHRR